MNTDMKIPAGQKRVAVIGAGIIGTMAAWQLVARGHQVTVFDQWNSPNDRGASAGESRIFRTIYKEGPEYVQFLQKSGRMWRELEASQGTQVLEWCGGLTIGHPNHPDVAAVAKRARDQALEHRVLDAAAMRAEFPQYAVDDDEVGVFDPDAGVFRPELAVLAARDEGIRHGAEYRTYTKVLNIRPLADSVAVDTAEGASLFDSVVLATGPWAEQLAGFDVPLVRAKRLVAAWYPVHDAAMHKPANMPVAIRRHAEGGYSCFPCLDGISVKILPHNLQWPDLGTVEELPRFIEPEFVRSAETTVARLMPHLDPTAIRVSTWTEGFTSDNAPIVGISPVDDRIVLAVGMSGQGFKFSPMIGSVVADLVTTGSSADAISIMDPSRFNAGASR